MNIIVQGKLIDTDNIDRIGDIDDGQGFFSRHEYTYDFTIWFLRGDPLTIYHKARMKDINSSVYFQDEQTKEKIKAVKEKAKKELIDLRNRIIDFWGKNPSKVPKFEINEKI